VFPTSSIHAQDPEEITHALAGSPFENIECRRRMRLPLSSRAHFMRRLTMVLLVLPVAGRGILPVQADGRNLAADGPSTDGCFRRDALAPIAGGAIDCLDGIRAEIVHAYETVSARPNLPRYAGAGETSIHRAIREAARLIREQQYLPAMTLLLDLEHDLLDAQKTGDIALLMDAWNTRNSPRVTGERRF